jgi:uncharacterized protein involved in exopolysaccharide biosynthesis
MDNPMLSHLSPRSEGRLEEGLSLLPPDPRASLDRALRLIWRWRWSFSLVFALICALGICYLEFAPKQYTARATLMVGFRRSELATAERTPSLVGPDIDGAIEIMTLPVTLIEVSSQLDLVSKQEFQRLLHGPVGSNPVEIIAFYLGKKVRIERVGHSNFVSVSYSSGDPSLSAAVVNQIANDSASGHVLRHMSLAEQSNFDMPETAVMSAAIVPFEASSPVIPMVVAATLVLAVSAATTTILLEDYYWSRRIQREMIRRSLGEAA